MVTVAGEKAIAAVGTSGSGPGSAASTVTVNVTLAGFTLTVALLVDSTTSFTVTVASPSKLSSAFNVMVSSSPLVPSIPPNEEIFPVELLKFNEPLKRSLPVTPVMATPVVAVTTPLIPVNSPLLVISTVTFTSSPPFIVRLGLVNWRAASRVSGVSGSGSSEPPPPASVRVTVAFTSARLSFVLSASLWRATTLVSLISLVAARSVLASTIKVTRTPEVPLNLDMLTMPICFVEKL